MGIAVLEHRIQNHVARNSDQPRFLKLMIGKKVLPRSMIICDCEIRDGATVSAVFTQGEEDADEQRPRQPSVGRIFRLRLAESFVTLMTYLVIFTSVFCIE